MDHFYNTIYGWFDFEPVYSDMVNKHGDGAHFVEVGAFYGKSSAYLAVEIVNSQKNIKLDIVDTWRGSEEHQENGWDRQDPMINDTAFDIFEQNMLPVKGHYTPIKLPSVEASKLYADESLDFVYIDAAHDYDSIKADVEAWLPKVKVGGYLCGHDYITWDPNDQVRRLIDEKFPGQFSLSKTSWIHHKTQPTKA